MCPPPLLVMAPSNGVSTGHLLHQARIPGEGLGCIQFSCWSRVPHGNLQTTQAAAKTQGCSPKTASGSIAELTSTHGTWGSQVGSYRKPASLPSSLLGERWYSVGYRKRKADTNHSSHKTLDLGLERWLSG